MFLLEQNWSEMNSLSSDGFCFLCFGVSLQNDNPAQMSSGKDSHLDMDIAPTMQTYPDICSFLFPCSCLSFYEYWIWTHSQIDKQWSFGAYIWLRKNQFVKQWGFVLSRCLWWHTVTLDVLNTHKVCILSEEAKSFIQVRTVPKLHLVNDYWFEIPRKQSFKHYTLWNYNGFLFCQPNDEGKVKNSTPGLNFPKVLTKW